MHQCTTLGLATIQSVPLQLLVLIETMILCRIMKFLRNSPNNGSSICLNTDIFFRELENSRLILLVLLYRKMQHQSQKPPQKVPLAIQKAFKEELDSMEQQRIISKCDTKRNKVPEWLNFFVIIKTPNGKLCVCLDPTDLNQYIV